MMWEGALGCSCKAIRLKLSVYRYFGARESSYLFTDPNQLCFNRIGLNDCIFIFLYRISESKYFPYEPHY
jgi:hypothetical protein